MQWDGMEGCTTGWCDSSMNWIVNGLTEVQTIQTVETCVGLFSDILSHMVGGFFLVFFWQTGIMHSSCAAFALWARAFSHFTWHTTDNFYNPYSGCRRGVDEEVLFLVLFVPTYMLDRFGWRRSQSKTRTAVAGIEFVLTYLLRLCDCNITSCL